MCCINVFVCSVFLSSVLCVFQFLCQYFPIAIVDEHVREAAGEALYDLFMVRI